MFETVWFRLAGLTFGNSIWSSSLVLASFMGGLALGSLLASRYGARARDPLRLFAALETAIGAAGLGLVLLFPVLTGLLVPIFRPWLEHPLALNTLRLMIAFALLLVPTTAMGATLPILVRALSSETGFGRALGRLYGWNTLGGVIGAVAGEGVLIGWLGLRGTGIAAASLDVLAALSALVLSLSHIAEPPTANRPHRTSVTRLALRLVVAATLSGAILLALEVVWFRFLSLFVLGTSFAFAVMLSVVLLGVSAGGFAAAFLQRRWPDAWRAAPLAALAAGTMVVVAYAQFDRALGDNPTRFILDMPGVFRVAVPLMLPTSLCSGLLFSLVGRALKEEWAGDVETAGRLTLANTTGAMAGALAAGFVLVPRYGVETSFFVLALAYGAVAACASGATGRSRHGSVVLVASAAAFLVVLFLFPFGLMRNHYVRLIARRFAGDGSYLVARREGRTETVLYLRRDLWGEPRDFTLVTNGFTMSGTGILAKRYMKLFVYWPLVFRPEARSALLISYGVGSTAKALTDTASLESIDVVDISRDVLDMSRTVVEPGGAHPLDDPRVRVHVEDGRFFLLASDRSFDLVTAEPPPPKNAGIVNLYSLEYFQLIHERLSEAGVVTYWLPVFLLEPSDTLAIVKGFCSVFHDCSLWNASGLEWMLVGSRGESRQVSEEAFLGQWRDPVVAPELRALGLEAPEQLGALFLADAEGLAALTRDVPPLLDDRPYRISSRIPRPPVDRLYAALMDVEAARGRFERSPFIAARWPAALRKRTLAAFEYQRVVNDAILSAGRETRWSDLHQVLTQSPLRTLPLWLMGSDEAQQRIVDSALGRGIRDPQLDYQRGLRAMADRDYARAEESFSRARAAGGPIEPACYYRILAACLAGHQDRARELSGLTGTEIAAARADRPFWAFAERAFGLPDPYQR